jgi:homoserine dehydrogenase
MMKHKDKITILKFGSSVLRSENDLPTVVHEIYRAWRDGERVIAVVSALGNTTDELQRRAENVCGQPDKSALAALLATGETVSSALLVMALKRAGIPARVFDAAEVGLRTVGGRLDAVPTAIDSARLASESRRGVVVMPGFAGRGESGDTTLLGRGGSDLTALFLAHRLSARCVLVKDVDGLYTSDPACLSVRAWRFSQVNYQTAARIGGGVVQPKAIRFAEANRLRFSITSIGSDKATEIGPFIDRLDEAGTQSNPLRVALLGCGTVGGGVYERLAALPHLFTVIGVGTRSVERALSAGVPSHLIMNDLDNLIGNECDIVVELIGGTTPAESLIGKALLAGRHVVTANKALLARSGERLHSLAAECGVTLRYNAAVGGVMPGLEAVERLRFRGPTQSFRGVLNGTTNFILDLMTQGEDFEGAVTMARENGYAEANCTLDLDGTDAAQKLLLLARKAFGVTPHFDAIERAGIENVDQKRIRDARSNGKIIRLVACCQRDGDALRMSVKPVELSPSDPLAATAGAENRLLIQTESAQSFLVQGQGAGRWPTTEAVMADLLDIRREVRSISEREVEAKEVCA